MTDKVFERYAIFYTPAAGPFAERTAAWLGWDSAKGADVAHPDTAGVDLAKLTARPRKYGFHATLKAPFHLTQTASLETLRQALDEFAQNHAAVRLGPLEISTTNGFLALRPTSAQPGLQELAAAVVSKLDRFRAPLKEEDIARRRRSRLTPRQDQHLCNWGYPYVMEDFQFHMTLTGPLRGNTHPPVLAQAHALITPVLPATLLIDAVTLMGQDAQGMFHQIRRSPLGAQ